MIHKGLYKYQVIVLAVICIDRGRNGGKQKETQTCIGTASAGSPPLRPGSLPSIFFYQAINRVQTLPTFHLPFAQEAKYPVGWRQPPLGTASPGRGGARNSQQGAGLTRIRVRRGLEQA